MTTKELDDDSFELVQHVAHIPRGVGVVAMDVIGHRGAASTAMENSLASIAAGLAAGADGVEVDVRVTADGVPVLMHDPDVSRTTGGSGRVRELGTDALRSLGVPTLAEALEAVPADRLLIVEVKGTPWEPGHDPAEPAARATAAYITRYPPRRVVVSSFNPLALAVVREMAPGVPTAVLTPPAIDLASNLAAAIQGGHDECHVPAVLLEPGFVREAQAAGRRVIAWTANDPEEIRNLAGWGVDGVITDVPRTALETLGRGDSG